MRRVPKYVQSFIDRHGRPRFYFRRAGFKVVRLPGLPWSPEFMAAYEAALGGQGGRIEIGANRTLPGSVDDAVVRYLGSSAFAALAPATQAMRRAILNRFREAHGDKRIGKLQPEHVARIIAALKPNAQRNWRKTLRGLMQFAMAERMIGADPTVGVPLAKVKDRGGHRTWTVAEIQQYRQQHALGTRARLALELLYGTMARREDATLLGRQHVQAGMLSFRQHKTNQQVDIPILSELQEAVDAMPKAEHLTFMVTELGAPFTPAGFGNWFRDQRVAAGLSDGLSAHGLRKSGATRLAEHGCTDHQIMAWGGWSSIKEVQRYTEAANRKRMAVQAAHLLKSGTEVSNLETRFDNQAEKP